MDTRLAGLITNNNISVASLSEDKKVLLVFLRHFECIFCREVLVDLSAKRVNYANQGIEIVFVHMSDQATAERYFEEYGLIGVLHIADKNLTYYQSFGLEKGSLRQLFGLKNMLRGLEIMATKKIMYRAKVDGDSTQMPGIFLVHKGEVTKAFIHDYISDKPDYDTFVK